MEDFLINFGVIFTVLCILSLFPIFYLLDKYSDKIIYKHFLELKEKRKRGLL